MIWVLFTVVAVLLVGVFAGLLAGRIGYDPLSEVVTSQPDTGLADDFTARSISDVHFDTALRGYRMDQVDHVLDALQDRIAEQEREIATLRGGDAAHRDASQREDVPHREHDA
ncbi:DivIVA domain-containing protein [Pedococcus cremeus]|uniref:DivIVA domain-containing protein n=1 Tax=Pedococcus cremeus TaxID=587636 RepID=A0A1H9RZ40_9MICO|nr:DivIVA domain-containing protein [Pedococcus cremeus]SER78060.1 DivIVA domain-containing protein [Pedococcus cremeus]